MYRYLHTATVEAMQISPETHIPEGEVLTPNTASIASITGWLLALGYTDFEVAEDGNAFGLSLEAHRKNRLWVGPGWWIVYQHGTFTPVMPQTFADEFQKVED